MGVGLAVRDSGYLLLLGGLGFVILGLALGWHKGVVFGIGVPVALLGGGLAWKGVQLRKKNKTQPLRIFAWDGHAPFVGHTKK